MADTDTDPGADPTPDEPNTLGDAGKKALDEERRARREAERQLREMQAQLQELTDKDKSEVDRLRDQLAQVTKERDTAASTLVRSEVAMAKGLSAAQAKRLVGSTREELEADADEILEAFTSPSGGTTPPPGQRPTEDLKGGSDPTSTPEPDIRKVIADIPR